MYCLTNIIRNIKSRRRRWAGYVERVGEKRNPYRDLFGKLEIKRPLQSPGIGGQDNVKMDF